MQKLINVLALASFATSACAVAAGIYVYQNKDALVDAAIELAMDGISGALVPDVPVLGGDAIPSPNGGMPPLTLPM